MPTLGRGLNITWGITLRPSALANRHSPIWNILVHLALAITDTGKQPKSVIYGADAQGCSKLASGDWRVLNHEVDSSSMLMPWHRRVLQRGAQFHKLLQERRKQGEIQRIRSIGQCLRRVIVHLHEQSIYTGSDAGAGQMRDVLRLTAGALSLAAGKL